MALTPKDLEEFPKEYEEDLKNVEKFIDDEIIKYYLPGDRDITINVAGQDGWYYPRVYEQVKKEYENKGWNVTYEITYKPQAGTNYQEVHFHLTKKDTP